MRILIVEDSKARLDIFREVLRGEIVTTDSPAVAIEMLSNLEFDVLFLDFDLGHQDCDGAMVAEWLEKNPQPDTRIIIHSMNPKGAEQMQRILPNAERAPFPPFEWPQRDVDTTTMGTDARDDRYIATMTA